MIKIILAEDHHVVRDGIKFLLNKQPDMSVIGEARNGQEVLDLIEQGDLPDVLLADINMPVIDGVSLISTLKASMPSVKIIMLTMLDHEAYVGKSFAAGCMGYLLKNSTSQEMLFAIRHVSDGHQYICSELAIQFLQKAVQAQSQQVDEEALNINLSERDREVLNLVADGYTNMEIADKLFTSKRTVEGYRQQLMTKTGTRNTATLIRFSAKHGLIS